jgi:hypothetical protein
MNTQEILSKLNIDINNQEAVNGALGALNALKKTKGAWPPPPPPPPTDPPLPGPPTGGEIDHDDMDEDDRAEKGKDGPGGMGGASEPLDKNKLRVIKHRRTLRAAKEQLAKAKEAGVAQSKIDALEQAIAEMESLTESTGGSIHDLSDEDFDKMIDKTLSAILDLGLGKGIKVDSEEEHKNKVSAFNAKINDANTVFDLEQEDSIQVSKDREQDLIQQQNLARNQRLQNLPSYRAADSFDGFGAFLDDLQHAIGTQVKYLNKKSDTWTALNRRYSGTGVLRQGQKNMRIPSNDLPVIDFYFDYSGSWGKDDIAVGHKALDAISQLEKDGLIKTNVYYFGGNVATDPSAVYRSSTTAWNEIIKTIRESNATNVVVMTDSDMEYLSNKARYTVPGYVWFLWKRGSNAQSLTQALQGECGTSQYAFNSSDYGTDNE